MKKENIYEVVWINSKDNTVCIKNIKAKIEIVKQLNDIRFLGFNKLHATIK